MRSNHRKAPHSGDAGEERDLYEYYPTGDCLQSPIGHKKLRRIYAEEKLQVRRRGGRKRALGTRKPMVLPPSRALLRNTLPGNGRPKPEVEPRLCE